MERLITFTSISAVTIASMGLALLIEVALLKVVFHFLAHVKDAPDAVTLSNAVRERQLTRRSVIDLRNAGL